MGEKPKKSKLRLPEWQFLLVWIGGQYAAFFVLLFIGVLATVFLNLLGIDVTGLSQVASLALMGGGFGLLTGAVQQWAIKKRFGHEIKGWSWMSAILTGLSFALVMPLIIALATARPDLFAGGSELLFVSVTYMAIFGAAGLGQAVLLRDRVKSAWLFFASTLVGGILYGLPVLGASPYFLAHTAQLSVTAFTIIWLFQMSSSNDALRADDGALARLIDENADARDDEEFYDDSDQQRGHLWRRFLAWLRLRARPA